jgi:hypothetical protein
MEWELLTSQSKSFLPRINGMKGIDLRKSNPKNSGKSFRGSNKNRIKRLFTLSLEGRGFSGFLLEPLSFKPMGNWFLPSELIPFICG